MHYYAFKVPFDLKEELKEQAKDYGMRCRFDYRMKRWEVFGKKLSKKRLDALVERFGEVWDWQTERQSDPYSSSVYKKGKKHEPFS